MAARETILAALRSARPEPMPAPDLSPFHAALSTDASVDAFERAARGWRAEVLRARPDDWPQAVRAGLDARACRRIAIGAASPLQPELDAALAGLAVTRFDRPLEDWKGALFDAIDAGVTSVDAGIAETGTLLLRPGAHEPRTLSLVPPVHVAVLRASRLHASLPVALQAVNAAVDLPTNLLLVSGPSKTADIQQTLAYGAHGPKELVIVVVEDRR